jgi:hypothetical protein
MAAAAVLAEVLSAAIVHAENHDAFVQEPSPAQGLADVLAQDFRKGNEPAVGWKIFGPQEMVKPEVGGLRVTIPAGSQKLEPVGLTPNVAIMGDFEVGIAYQMLSVERPRKGYGSGVNIWLKLRSDKNHILKIAHYDMPRDGNVFFLGYNYQDETKEKIGDPMIVPAMGLEGRIALRRKSSDMFFLAGPVDGDCKELRRIKVSADHVERVRFVVFTGNSPTALDVRILETYVRMNSRQDADPVNDVIDAATGHSNVSVCVVSGVLLVSACVSIAFLAYWLLRRRV